MSVSAGVAVYSLDNNLLMLDDLIKNADRALYQAKASGRNRVSMDFAKSGTASIRNPVSLASTNQ